MTASCLSIPWPHGRIPCLLFWILEQTYSTLLSDKFDGQERSNRGTEKMSARTERDKGEMAKLSESTSAFHTIPLPRRQLVVSSAAPLNMNHVAHGRTVVGRINCYTSRREFHLLLSNSSLVIGPNFRKSGLQSGGVERLCYTSGTSFKFWRGTKRDQMCVSLGVLPPLPPPYAHRSRTRRNSVSYPKGAWNKG